jgi:hypothetical protein
MLEIRHSKAGNSEVASYAAGGETSLCDLKCNGTSLSSEYRGRFFKNKKLLLVGRAIEELYICTFSAADSFKQLRIRYVSALLQNSVGMKSVVEKKESAIASFCPEKEHRLYTYINI